MTLLLCSLIYLGMGYATGFAWAKLAGVKREKRRDSSAWDGYRTDLWVGGKSKWGFEDWTLSDVFWTCLFLFPGVIAFFTVGGIIRLIGGGTSSLYSTMVRLTYPEEKPKTIAPPKTPELIAAEREVDALLGEYNEMPE